MPNADARAAESIARAATPDANVRAATRNANVRAAESAARACALDADSRAAAPVADTSTTQAPYRPQNTRPPTPRALKCAGNTPRMPESVKQPQLTSSSLHIPTTCALRCPTGHQNRLKTRSSSVRMVIAHRT